MICKRHTGSAKDWKQALILMISAVLFMQNLGARSEAPAGGLVQAGEPISVIKERVLRRGALASDLEKNKLRWYYYYEYGVKHLNAGEPGRALHLLLMSANLKEQPERDERMYGMWFVDYLPYYYIARAHADLGDWNDASDALILSDQLESIQPSERSFGQYAQLKDRISRRCCSAADGGRD